MVSSFASANFRVQIKPFHFVQVKWSRTAPAEHNGLSAGFIHHPVAVESARNGDRFTLGRIGRNQFRVRPRTESLRTRNGIGRDQLNHAQTVSSISDESELRRVHASDLDCARVVEQSAGIEHLVEPRSFRIFHVDDRESFRAVRHVCVGARDIEPSGISQPDHAARNRRRSIGIADVENLQSVIIRDEGVTKLNRDAMRVAQETRR